MAPEDGHVRLAIATFSSMTDLSSALDKLSAVDVGDDQLCLAALLSTIDRIEAGRDIAAALKSRLSPVIDKAHIIPPAIEDIRTMRASGWLLDALSLGQSDAATSVVADATSWMTPDKRAEMMGSIVDGDIVLGVRSDNRKQQQSTTRTLLRHSVQTGAGSASKTSQWSGTLVDTGNENVADKMREMADILELQHEDGYRIAAYRRAARSLMELERPIDEIIRIEGIKGVMQLPGIGRGIGAAIVEIVSTGSWSKLDRLSGTLEPEKLFQTVPGIGPGLAARIHDDLHLDTLEHLEQAAHDGRLEGVSGIGARRALAIKGALTERLGHRHFRRSGHAVAPPIDILLDVDREYLTKAAQDSLRKIAPKRFNPAGDAWLPVLHTRRGDWQFTVLFSNTQRAHELDKTRDWVVIYFHINFEPEAQCTIVTETRGPLEGRRVVRGREGDCIAHYAAAGQTATG